MFKPDGEGGYWQKLPAEFGGVELRIARTQASTPELNWWFVDAFTKFVLAEGHNLAAKAQLPLRFLASQTGWFAGQAATAAFEWQEIVLLYDAAGAPGSALTNFTYELHFTLLLPGQTWADSYGNWVTTYHGSALTGLRREQL